MAHSDRTSKSFSVPGLRDWRERQVPRMSLRGLEARTGLSFVFLGNLERGRRRASPGTLLLLQQAGVPPEVLLDVDGDEDASRIGPEAVDRT